MSALFSPLKVKDITFKNRIGVAPMCQYSSVDGVAQDWHVVQNGTRAVGGAGLIIMEATAVTPEGRITPACAGLWNDEQTETLKPITAFMEQHGCVPGIQIGHAGRKGSSAKPWDGGAHLKDEDGGYEIFGPSDEAFDDDGVRLWRAPSAMSDADIARIQDAFVDCTKRSLDAGYKLLELHAAHGYLLNSFFSPLVNKRTDQYGGSDENRARMLLEVTEKVRAIWPENLPLAVRVSTSDWAEGGVTLEHTIQLAKWLKEHGVDFIDCSSGGATPAARASIGNNTCKQVGHSEILKRDAGVMTMAVGEITNAKQAEEIIATGQADIALLGRQIIREPSWPLRAAKELGANTKTQVPIQISNFVG